MGDPLLLRRPGPRIPKTFPLARISMLCFPTTWTDLTESFVRAPWDMQADGSRPRLSDPNHRGGTNNLFGEGKRALVGPKPEFSSLGCLSACHAGGPREQTLQLLHRLGPDCDFYPYRV
ncbi:MAG TPA: hypothetical protein VJJ46_08830 [Anaerolineales bacterium]|nr:hypothetical protein [Anaerolineales bacterium]